MGFRDNINNFLGMVSKKELEVLNEKLATQELLMKNEEEYSADTFSSSAARETHDKKDIQGLTLKRIPVSQLQQLYLNNQFIFRGVNVRADELTTRGYEIIGDDEAGVEKCFELIENSGGINLFWQYSVNTDVAGDGYLEKIYNKAKNKIVYLKHINPVSFGFKTDEENHNRIIVDKNGNPVGYEQTVIDNDGVETRKDVSKDIIAHLRFNTFADEFNGISSLQSVYNTAIRLMNMEHAAAEAAVKTANPTWVVKTMSKSPQDLNKWSQILGRVSAKEVVFLPDGVDTKLESPGNQNFSDYSNYFLDAVVAALGVPKSILTGSSDKGGGNRATVNTLSKHFYSTIRANQRYEEDVFNEIFVEYGKIAGFEPPYLRFNDIAEDADRNGQRAVELFTTGLITIEEARTMIGLETDEKLKNELQKENKQVSNSEIDPDKEEKKDDMETFFPNGSQKGVKDKQKMDSTVPSVR